MALRGGAAAVAVALTAGCAPQPTAHDRLTVLCPTGVGDLLAPAIQSWGTRNGIAVHIVEDEAERIARQVNGGAQADLFVSAEPVWLAQLDRDDHLAPGPKPTLFIDPLVIATRTQPARPVHSPADLVHPSPLRVAVAQQGWEGNAAQRALAEVKAPDGRGPQLILVDHGEAAMRRVLAGDADAALVRQTAALSGEAEVSATKWSSNPSEAIEVQAAVLRGGRHAEAAAALCSHLADAPEARARLGSLGLHLPPPAAQTPAAGGSAPIQ